MSIKSIPLLQTSDVALSRFAAVVKESVESLAKENAATASSIAALQKSIDKLSQDLASATLGTTASTTAATPAKTATESTSSTVALQQSITKIDGAAQKMRTEIDQLSRSVAGIAPSGGAGTRHFTLVSGSWYITNSVKVEYRDYDYATNTFSGSRNSTLKEIAEGAAAAGDIALHANASALAAIGRLDHCNGGATPDLGTFYSDQGLFNGSIDGRVTSLETFRTDQGSFNNAIDIRLTAAEAWIAAH